MECLSTGLFEQWCFGSVFADLGGRKEWSMHSIEKGEEYFSGLLSLISCASMGIEKDAGLCREEEEFLCT